VSSAEVATWRDAAQAVVVAYDAELGVHSQAEGFTRHQRWDFDTTDPDHYPLLLHFPYFDLYRKQVVKQADLVLALHRCGEAFSEDEKARAFEYYEALTVRDSSLSASTQATIAAEVGHLELAYDYLAEAALIDLDDIEHNTRDGLHIAALAGAWLAAVAGFGGLRDHGGELSFTPRLPAAITRLAFGLSYLGADLGVEVVHGEARYSLRAGEAIEIRHHGERVTIGPGPPVTLAIPPHVARPAPTQPRGRVPARRDPGSTRPSG
jgi:alpha,alpha-trehalose phosphorylase